MTMNAVVNFFLETLICFSLFFAVYYFLLRNETCFQYNRLYLLVTAIISIAFPLIDIQFSTDNAALHNLTVEQVIYLPEVVVDAEKPTVEATPVNYWVTGLLIIYFAGMAIVLLRLIIEIIKITKLYRQALKESTIEGNIIFTNGKAPTFSFLNFIFLDNNSFKNDEEKTQVIMHEMAHVKHRHTWDILFLEILATIFWFNPVIRWYKKAIAEMHEYIADKEALHHYNKEGYVKTLVHQGLKQMNISLVQPFNASQLLKRINMMDKYNQPTRLFKMLMVIPVAAVLFVVFSFSDTMLNIPSTVEQSLPSHWKMIETNEVDADLLVKLQEFKSKYPDHEFYLVRHTGLQEVSFLLNQNWKIIYTGQYAGVGIAIAEYSTTQHFIEIEEVFTIVEDQPQPVGGMSQMYQFVAENLKYPEQAQRMGIEGKVFVQFVVDTDGTIDEVQVVKGIGAGCDVEAARVISKLPPWKPGIQRGHPVKVRLILPITFQLSQEQKEQNSNSTEEIELGLSN